MSLRITKIAAYIVERIKADIHHSIIQAMIDDARLDTEKETDGGTPLYRVRVDLATGRIINMHKIDETRTIGNAGT